MRRCFSSTASKAALPPLTAVSRNQPPALLDYNVFRSDPVIVEAMTRWAPQYVEGVTKWGEWVGSSEAVEAGVQANKNSPTFRTHDRFGNRVNLGSFHPSYHVLMKEAIANETPNFYWNRRREPGAMVARCVRPYVLNQIDSGVNCPLTMTFAAHPSLENTAVGKQWIPRILSAVYDPSDRPASLKNGATLGMSMTEKQGGSDVRQNETTATPLNGEGGRDGDVYLINGHKWFTSAIMCDGFLTLAKTKKGISCFLVPRWKNESERNSGFVILQLKDKLGDRSNIGTEVEYHNAYGELIGEEGRGIAQIMEMVAHTRLDCILGSSGTMRASLSQAIHHCSFRSAFGARLLEKPLMMNVLTDLAVESEAATLAAMRLAYAFEEGDREEFRLSSAAFAKGETNSAAAANNREALLARIAVAVMKYFVCKVSPAHVFECMEALGGNGYVEDSFMPRLYKQAPLNSIWEGAGNVQCLDMIRAAVKEPQSLVVFMEEVAQARGQDKRFDAYFDGLKKDLKDVMGSKDSFVIEGSARILVEKMARAFQASLLLRYGNADVTDLFLTSRLAPSSSSPLHCFGTLPAVSPKQFAAVIERNLPRKTDGSTFC